jgi:outer membrane receptor protein involved in Fe transport
MSRKQAFFPRALLLVCILFAIAAFAQTTASIKGTVSDSSGAAIVGAKVIVRNPDAGIERHTQTNSSGDYEVPALPPGLYSVEVQSEKFSTQIAKDLRLEVSKNSVQNFNLNVAGSGQVITVEASAPTIETTTITVGQTIDQKTVQDIPLNGRHFVDLALLIPGTVTPPQNGFLTAPLRGQGSFAFNTAGNREDTVNFMVNGVNLNDMVQNQITFQPSINTVSEFKVDNSTYSAEYGRNSGAIVNIATRSGSNGYHGELFEFVRNHDLDARNFFNTRVLTSPTGVQTPNPQATFKRNSFGANFGGPIYKDKTFFFLSYEALRQRQGIPLNTTVLSDAQRATVQAGGNPTSLQLLNLIPVANSGNSFVGSALAPVNIDQGTADISHNFNSNLRIHGYFAIQEDLRQEPTLQGDTLPGFGDTRQSRRQIATINLDHTLSSNMVNEARLGFNRIHIVFAPNALQNPASFGIQDGINAAAGLPFITIGGTQIGFGGPSGFPQGRGDTTGVLSDTLNYLHGRHSLKFGGEFRRMTNNNFASDTGTLSFTNVAGFAAGTPTGFSLSPGNNPSRIAVNNLGFFVQDSWKTTKRLTLELGLRYDWNATPTEAQDRFVNFIAATDSLVRVSSPYKQNNKNFQPRLGFAYDVFGSGKTVVRGAYAILTDQPITGLVTGLTNNPPLGNPLSFVGGGAKPTTTYATLLADAKGNGLAPIVVDPNFDNSYIESYNLNIQQQVTNNWSLMTGFFGSAGRHLRTRINENQFVNGARPFANLSASSPILPGAAIGNISENVSNGNSSYNALWVTSNMRPFHGFQFNASYTFSKSLDFTSQNGQGVVLQDSLNPAADKGLSDFDARNRFVVNFIYDLPFKGNRLVDGWQIGSIISDQSGNPVNLQANGVGIGGLTGLTTLRPDLTGPIQILDTPLTNGSGNIQYFANSVCDPAVAAKAGQTCGSTSFQVPDAFIGGKTIYHLGNFGRNVIIGPGFNNVDMSLVKRTKITERFSSELRFEAFDLLNHANLGQPGRIAQANSTSFGVISSTRFPTGDSGSARQLQFAAKLTF